MSMLRRRLRMALLELRILWHRRLAAYHRGLGDHWQAYAHTLRAAAHGNVLLAQAMYYAASSAAVDGLTRGYMTLRPQGPIRGQEATVVIIDDPI